MPSRSRSRRLLGAVTAVVVAAALVAVTFVVTRPAPIAAPTGVTASDAIIREHFRLPRVDGARLSPNQTNYASRTRPTSPLLLFLAATHHRPADYRDFLSVARAAGYHVLALSYWNTGRSVQKTCRAVSTCYTQVQRNRLDGTHPSVYSRVDPANSIVARLGHALTHLRESDPQGGWGRFTNANGIDWRRIVVAGHSQGGGESAYIAHIHRVRGALMFSSPVDSDQGVTASWMAHPGVTPVSRLYGFDDTGDGFYDRIVASWDAMGMGELGAPQTVTSAGDYRSHELVSTRHLGRPAQAHLRTITDDSPRARNGSPAFAPVWKWMLRQLYTQPAAPLPTTASRSNA